MYQPTQRFRDELDSIIRCNHIDSAELQDKLYHAVDVEREELKKDKERNAILVTVEGGNLSNIINIPKGITIIVRDYDVENTCEDDERITQDDDGEDCFESIWEG